MTDPVPASDDSSSLDVLLDEVIAEIGRRVQTGEPVEVEQYVRMFPDREPQIRQLLPAMQALATLGRGDVCNGGEPTTAQLRHHLQLDEFRILRQLGHGGMGVVYEAEQLSLGRHVALKILPFASLLDEHRLQRFHAEATAAGRLQHPHIVPVYSVGCERGVHYYAMQLIDGPSLAEVIAQLRERRA
ncbi:MAG: hypothetical protein FJ276_17485, partial [Planctomycetes bacterium]|nr:hypothetical protein [Planctomycetota bacterium]